MMKAVDQNDWPSSIGQKFSKAFGMQASALYLLTTMQDSPVIALIYFPQEASEAESGKKLTSK